MTSSSIAVSTTSPLLQANIPTASGAVSVVSTSSGVYSSAAPVTVMSATTVTTASSPAICTPKATAAGTLIPNRIFVGGIPINTTEQDLRNFFSTYGPVKDVKVITDRSGLSKGSYGFVTFENQKVAEKLIKSETDSIIFRDRKLNIGQAIRKQQSSIKQDLPGAFLLSNGGIPYPLQSNLALLQIPGQEAIASSNMLSPYAAALMVDPALYGSLHQGNVPANTQHQHQQLLASNLVNQSSALTNSNPNPYIQALTSSSNHGALSIQGIGESTLEPTCMSGNSPFNPLQYLNSLSSVNQANFNSKHSLSQGIHGLSQVFNPHQATQAALLGLDDSPHVSLSQDYVTAHANAFNSFSGGYPHFATTGNYLPSLKSATSSGGNLDETLHQAKRRRLDFNASDAASIFYNSASGAAFL